MMMEMKNKSSLGLIITAAGSSSRIGTGCKKEYVQMSPSGRTVLSAAAEAFLLSLEIETIIITFKAGTGKSGEQSAKDAFFADSKIKKIFEQQNAPNLLFVEGGSTRQESVFNGLKALSNKPPKYVIIHDGARPYVTKEIILELYNGLQKYDAVTCGIQPVDTQKEINPNNTIERHLRRSNLCAVQTPQAFNFSLLIEAHKKANCNGQEYTDDTEIWTHYIGTPVYITKGSSTNKKITFAEDLQSAQAQGKTMKQRIGLGYDLHKLVENRKLVIGGVTIPFDKGEAGHSDGDVLLHAITDALLGAASLGDIGEMFPPSDAKWKDADSKELLKQAWQRVLDAGWNLGNLDCVLKLEKPKLLPYRNEIINSIANILNISCDKVFVKAKTGEGLEAVGKGEAIEAYATCLLESDN